MVFALGGSDPIGSDANRLIRSQTDFEVMKSSNVSYADILDPLLGGVATNTF